MQRGKRELEHWRGSVLHLTNLLPMYRETKAVFSWPATALLVIPLTLFFLLVFLITQGGYWLRKAATFVLANKNQRDQWW